MLKLRTKRGVNHKDSKMTENVLNIDGKGYAEADLNNKQKYLIAQLKDLSGKTNKLRSDLDQVQRIYLNALNEVTIQAGC